MGYDCTLHLIDEQAIREEFVPRLLKRSRKKTALDRVFTNAAGAWTHVRKLLEKGDPADAATQLCSLAISFSACSLPHHYERGFAISLWDNQGELSVEFPTEYLFDPEPLFTEVVARYPALHGKFPRVMTCNYTPGVYIPADKVPEVLAWVEQRVGQFTKGERRTFKGLLRILRMAAERSLAYWEATDLAIPVVGQSAGGEGLMTADFLGNVPGTPGSAVEAAPLEGHCDQYDMAILGSCLVSSDVTPFGTNIWDLSAWPPPLVATVPIYAPYHDLAPDGTWLLLGGDENAPTPYVFRPHRWTGPGSDLEAIPFDGDPRSKYGGWIGECLLLFQNLASGVKEGDRLPAPLWWDGRTWGHAPGLPEVVARTSTRSSSVAYPVCGLVRLPGGTVVIWDGNGYEWTGDAFVRTFTLDVGESYVDWTSCPAGEDGFFYLSNRRLFEVHRGGRPRQHGQPWTNIMVLQPGPDGSLLLKEGGNDDGDLGKLYFPADGTFIHIEPELFDDKDYSILHYSAGSQRFVTSDARQFLAVPAQLVLSLPRHRASDGKLVS
jgi:hypothetical protein